MKQRQMRAPVNRNNIPVSRGVHVGSRVTAAAALAAVCLVVPTTASAGSSFAPRIEVLPPVSVSFAATAQAVQQFTVPEGVTSLNIDALGGSGTPGGGKAGHVTGTLAVTPGSVLDIWVGFAAAAPSGVTAGVGGWGGFGGLRHGGNGGAGGAGGPSGGGAGGGATEIDLHDGSASPPVLAIGGGGGGAAVSFAGANCGDAGTGGCGAAVNGAGIDGVRGPGGGTAPGLGGVAGGSGAGGVGGAGSPNGWGGGGGGGGFGGGGGSPGSSSQTPSGGGSGRSFGPAGAIFGTAAVLGNGAVTLSYTPASAPTGATRFVPLNPFRLLDTRLPGDITAGHPVAAGNGIDVQVAGVGGVPPTNVTAVVLNVTAADALAPGFVTVWPSAQSRPEASNLNVTAVGQNIANLVTVRLGAGGKVSMFSQSGADLIADVAGYYEPVVSTIGAGRYTSLPPTRILDTRSSLGVPGTVPVPPNSQIDVIVAGRGGVPATGVSAVVMNVTAAEALGVGYVTVWPAGLTRPTASTLNVTAAGQNIANLVIVPLGANGAVSLYTQAGTHLVADVAGWFGDSTQPASFRGLFEPLTPTRVLDTRSAIGIGTTTPVAPGSAIVLDLAGHGGVPLSGYSAVVLNVTAADATAPGFVTIWPPDTTQPTASNLNVTAIGQNIPNLVSVSVSAAGSVALFTQAGCHLIADVAGYYLS